MALKDLWGRLSGRKETPEAPPEPSHVVPPPPLPGPQPEPSPEVAPELPASPIALPIPAPVQRPGPTPMPAPMQTPFPALPPTPLPEPILEPEPPPPPELPVPVQRSGFFSRLRSGLSRSTARLTDGIAAVFTKRRLDDAALEELEEMLIAADLGLPVASRIVARFRATRFGREVTDIEVKTALAEEIAAILAPVARPLEIDRDLKPHVVLVVGVNGTGKTTTIAKLAQGWREEGRAVWMAAGDTFRAAAVEQLQVWGERTGCPVVAPAKQGADAAGLAFDALTQARAAGAEILLIDTAGRLHNKAALMDELRKVVRVLKRIDPAVPHSVLLVLDATTGQNAVNQVRVFRDMVDVTGLVVTKLDGSAKGGVLVALAEAFGLPVHAVGVGEKAADLRPFEARDYARSLVGLD